MSEPDIFISYSREDRAAARHFADCFASEGFSVWWDAALRSGQTFDEVIEAALKGSKAVVVLWSPRSVTSRWVRAEATLADRHNKLVPVIIEPCDRPLIFELTHTADFSGWSGDTTDFGWQSFLRDLRRMVGKDESSASPATGASEASRERDSRSTFSTEERFVPLSRGFDPSRFPAPERREPVRPEPQPQPSAGRSRVSLAEPSDQTQFSVSPGRSGAADHEEFHCLELTVGGRMEKRFIVSPTGLKIGRAEPSDVILADTRVSRSHCTVELRDNRIEVSDLNSTNGTFVDGERIEGSAILEVGSILRVGNVLFKHAVRSRAEV